MKNKLLLFLPILQIASILKGKPPSTALISAFPGVERIIVLQIACIEGIKDYFEKLPKGSVKIIDQNDFSARSQYRKKIGMQSCRSKQNTSKSAYLRDIISLEKYEGDACSVIVQDSLRGGTFKQVNLASPDGGIVFKRMRGGYWVRTIVNSIIYPEWFGAKRDSVTNDVAAIRATLASAENKYIVGLKRGYYWTDTTDIVTSQNTDVTVKIIGAGKDKSFIVRRNGNTGSSTNCFDIHYLGLHSNVYMSDFTIIGPDHRSPHSNINGNSNGIKWSFAFGLHGYKTLTVERVRITGTFDEAITNSAGGNVTVNDCDLSATDAIVGMFESNGSTKGNSFEACGGIWQCAHGDASSHGSVGLYIHPNVPYKLTGVTFKYMGRYAIYQNGSLGTYRPYAVASGCAFDSCEMAHTEGTGLSTFSHCIVNGSESYLGSKFGGDVEIENCSFARTYLSYGSISTSNVSFIRCSFVDTYIQSGNRFAGAKWNFNSCNFKVTNNYTKRSPILNVLKGTTTLNNVTFTDVTTTAIYFSFILSDGGTINADRVIMNGNTGAMNGDIFLSSGSLHIYNSIFTPTTIKANAIVLASGFQADSLTGFGNTFNKGCEIGNFSGNRQRLE